MHVARVGRARSVIVGPVSWAWSTPDREKPKAPVTLAAAAEPAGQSFAARASMPPSAGWAQARRCRPTLFHLQHHRADSKGQRGRCAATQMRMRSRRLAERLRSEISTPAAHQANRTGQRAGSANAPGSSYTEKKMLQQFSTPLRIGVAAVHAAQLTMHDHRRAPTGGRAV